MIKWKHQIQEGELHEMRVLLVEGYSIPQIALRLGRSKSTLYRLFQKNGVSYGERRYRYVGWKSGERIYREDGEKKIQMLPRNIYLQRERRRSLASRRYVRITSWGKLESYVLEKLKNAWSPKQISGRWKLETGEKLSKDTIYRFVYSMHKELIWKHFRRKWKRYQHDRSSKYQLMDRRMINERREHYPKCEARTEVWHWEGDTVVGIRWWSKQVILTNVERKTGYLLAEKLKRRTGECVLEATREFFKKLPKYKRKSITYDNWREFSEHKMIEYSTKLRVFFAHPYSSWERGTNENTNWLLRQFVPKKTDFTHVTNKALKTYVHLINHRPRERLNFLTPHEVFMEWKSCIWL